MDIKNIYYTYAYLDPRKPGNYIYGQYQFDYEPFYIGKGKKKRYKEKHNNDCENRLDIIKSIGFEPIYEFIDKNLNECNAHNKEREYIKKIGRLNNNTGPLTNKTGGGAGSSGRIISEDQRKKVSGENNPAKRLEVREKISKSMKGKYLGRKLGPETKQKMSKNNYMKKFGQSNLSKQKISEKMRKIWIVIKPNFDIVEVNNMKQYCIENNLSYSCMKNVSCGKYENHKGYSCKVRK